MSNPLASLSPGQRKAVLIGGGALLLVVVLMLARRRGGKTPATSTSSAGPVPVVDSSRNGTAGGFGIAGLSPSPFGNNFDTSLPPTGITPAVDTTLPASSIDVDNLATGIATQLGAILSPLQGGVNGGAGSAPAASPPQPETPSAPIAPPEPPPPPSAPGPPPLNAAMACKERNKAAGLFNESDFEAYHVAVHTPGWSKLTPAQKVMRWRAYIIAHGGCIP